jgi:alkanesulfonate monooxygenase SsuD/methylene tetrahydromethanopterin reductase-like flavin-dependent oxidoreductase (luciferase family)
LIGGGGEQKTLRLVARYGDACNLFARLPADQLAHKLELLRGYCQQEGRAYEDVEKTVLVQLAPGRDDWSTSAFVDQLGRLADLGFDTAIASLQDVQTPVQTVEMVGRDVIPQVQALSARVPAHRDVAQHA